MRNSAASSSVNMLSPKAPSDANIHMKDYAASSPGKGPKSFQKMPPKK